MKSVTVANIMSRLGGETTVPVGPLYIAAVLDRAGYDVDFRDYQVASYENSLRQKNILDFLSDSERVLGVSCLFNTLPFVLLALKRVKEENPEKTIILGGAGPSSVAAQVMEEFPFVDVVVKGEGEKSAEELAKGVVYKDVRGIVYQSGGKVVTTLERERIHDLDALPLPAYGKIDLSQYDHAGVITARGCVYHCSFCEVAPLWGHHTVQRSVLNVMDEIKMLYELGVKNIHIHDDTFVLNRKLVLAFCDAVQRECPDITWTCNGRINLMDKALLSVMADAGCVAVQYGIESGSQRVLKMVGKQINVAHVKEVVTVSAEYMKTITTFMWGFPFETLGDLFETVYLIRVPNPRILHPTNSGYI